MSAKWSILLAGIAATIAVADLSVSAAGAQGITLRVSMPVRQGALFAPYNIGLDKGYYKEEGLDLDIKIAGGGVATPAQIAGDIDINTSGPAAIIPILRGGHLKLVYTLATHSTDVVWSTAHDIKSLRDLKGLQVGVISRGDTNEIGVRMALLKEGLPADCVNYTALGQLNNILATLKVGSLPAVVLGGVSYELAGEAGYLDKGNLLYDESKSLEMPYNSIAVTDQFLSGKHGALEGFLRATLKAVRFMKKNKAGSVAVMRKYDSESSVRVLEADYDRLFPVLSNDGTVPEDARRVDLQVRASLIGLPEDKLPPLDQVYDYSIVRSVNAELDASGWTPSP